MSLIQPNAEQLIRIKKVTNENEATISDDLEMIKNWLRQQPHLPNTYDDQRLLNFLRGCKFSIEKCKRKLELYFIKRSTEKQFFTNRDITRPELCDLIPFLHGSYLPKLTPEGCRVAIGGILKEGFSDLPMTDIFKLIFMAGDMRLSMEKHYVAGDIYILDTKNVFAKQLMKIPLGTVKQFFVCLEAYPTIIKEVHLLNISPLVAHAKNFMKPLVKEKLMKRVHLHTSLDTLYEFVPKEVLPEEYGGSAGKQADIVDDWMKKMIEFKPWFDKEEEIVADLSKKPSSSDDWDIFGPNGSFRKIVID